MSKSKLEYIWLDGYKPTSNLRSKTKVVEDFSGKLEDCEVWSFDGSSTQQAEGGSSDCLLEARRYLPRSNKNQRVFSDDGSIECRWICTCIERACYH